MIQFDSRYGLVSFPEIQQFESRLRISLPDDYKEFLLKWNGGKPSLDRFVVREWAHQATVVSRFFAIHSGRHSNLERVIKDYEDRLPQSVIPIGEDPFGNLICLGLEESSYGRVYFWDHEDELDKEGLSKTDFSNMYELADGIGPFINSLEAS